MLPGIWRASTILPGTRGFIVSLATTTAPRHAMQKTIEMQDRAGQRGARYVPWQRIPAAQVALAQGDTGRALELAKQGSK